MTWEPDYVTAAELKTELHVTDNVDDAQMARWVTSASRIVDSWAHRQFGQVATAESRTYVSRYDRTSGTYIAEIDDLQDITGLAVLASAVAVTDYTLLPLNADKNGKPFERIRLAAGGDLDIEGFWGWSAVPTPVKSATLLQAARLAARRDSPYGIAGSPSEGSEMRLTAVLDPDARMLLGIRYRREWWAA